MNERQFSSMFTEFIKNDRGFLWLFFSVKASILKSKQLWLKQREKIKEQKGDLQTIEKKLDLKLIEMVICCLRASSYATWS
jgi:hypothetical protein